MCSPVPLASRWLPAQAWARMPPGAGSVRVVSIWDGSCKVIQRTSSSETSKAASPISRSCWSAWKSRVSRAARGTSSRAEL